MLRSSSPGRRFVADSDRQPTSRARFVRGLAGPVGLGALALLAAVGPTVTWALWSDSATTAEIRFQPASFGFAVDWNDNISAIQRPDETVSIDIGPTEAMALVAGGTNDAGWMGLAVPFDITMMTSAGYAMDYVLELPHFDSTTVLGWGGTTPVFFQVSQPGECTVAAATTATPYDSDELVSGIDPGSGSPQTLVHHWCVVFEIAPPMYQNSATAVGTDAVGGVIAAPTTINSSWRVYHLPDPSLHSISQLEIIPVLTPGCDDSDSLD